MAENYRSIAENDFEKDNNKFFSLIPLIFQKLKGCMHCYKWKNEK